MGHFAEGRQVHVAAAVGLDGGFRYFEEQALGWVLEERDATGAKFDDDVLVGFNLAESRTVVGDGFDELVFQGIEIVRVVTGSAGEIRTELSKGPGDADEEKGPQVGLVHAQGALGVAEG